MISERTNNQEVGAHSISNVPRRRIYHAITSLGKSMQYSKHKLIY